MPASPSPIELHLSTVKTRNCDIAARAASQRTIDMTSSATMCLCFSASPARHGHRWEGGDDTKTRGGGKVKLGLSGFRKGVVKRKVQQSDSSTLLDAMARFIGWKDRCTGSRMLLVLFGFKESRENSRSNCMGFRIQNPLS